MEENEQQNPKKKKKDKATKSGRSTDTMFKTLLTNLVRLSNMADQKAGLMISVNSIIVSIVISFVLGHIGENKNLLLPTFLLLFVCLLTIVFAILATRPTVDKKLGKDTDLLFFGHFSSFTLNEYVHSMQELLKDEANLQSKMLSNMHAQGLVLDNKYKYLKISYTVFMVGFPLVIVVYILALTNFIK
jgi:hypothetical protein